MIKINLNRSRVAGGAEEPSAIGLEPLRSAANGREILIKLLVIVIGTLGLMLYEKQNIDDLNSQLVTVQAQDQQLKTQLLAKQDELKKLKDIEPQAQSLNEKLKLLRDYSKQRITELQSMDYMQSVIPERVWLRSVKFDNHRYTVMGNAMETIDLTDFVGKLENSAYFQDVIVVQDKEKQAAKNGKIRDFEFTAREEAKN